MLFICSILFSCFFSLSLRCFQSFNSLFAKKTFDVLSCEQFATKTIYFIHMFSVTLQPDTSVLGKGVTKL